CVFLRREELFWRLPQATRNRFEPRLAQRMRSEGSVLKRWVIEACCTKQRHRAVRPHVGSSQNVHREGVGTIFPPDRGPAGVANSIGVIDMANLVRENELDAGIEITQRNFIYLRIEKSFSFAEAKRLERIADRAGFRASRQHDCEIGRQRGWVASMAFEP